MGELLRLDKKVLSVGSLNDTEYDKAFWLSKNGRERIAAIELNRRMIYGEDNTTSRLQRFLETFELARC